MDENTLPVEARVTVNLIKEAHDALMHAADQLDHLSYTDVINRALQVYDYVLTLQRELGATIYIRRDGSDELIALKILARERLDR